MRCSDSQTACMHTEGPLSPPHPLTPPPPQHTAFMLVRLGFLLSLLATFPLQMAPFRSGLRRAQGGRAVAPRRRFLTFPAVPATRFPCSPQSLCWPSVCPPMQGLPVEAAVQAAAAGPWPVAGHVSHPGGSVLERRLHHQHLGAADHPGLHRGWAPHLPSQAQLLLVACFSFACPKHAVIVAPPSDAP